MSHVMWLEVTRMERKEDTHKMPGNIEVKDNARFKAYEIKQGKKISQTFRKLSLLEHGCMMTWKNHVLDL